LRPTRPTCAAKAKNRAFKPEPKKYAVTTLVERDGRANGQHDPPDHREARQPRTDENLVYVKLGREFAGHSSVNHSADEYARLDPCG
jgi:hypothetical protein